MVNHLKIDQVDSSEQAFELILPAFAGGLKDTHLPGIFKWLAGAVINQPYKDLPQDYLDILGHRIYRPNHDIAHSMRQVMYLNVLKTWVMRYGKKEYQVALQEVTGSEWNLLSLASFLFRSGRTNEQSSKSGLSQNKNSAEIFKAVAWSLGFPTLEVELLAWCIENYAPLTSTTIESMPVNTPKSRLFNGFLLLAHNGDLPRCWANENEIGLSTRDNFTALMNLSGDEINQLHETYLAIARLLCNVTGTSYYWPSRYGQEKCHPHVIYKQQCVSRFDDAFDQVTYYTDSVVSILEHEPTLGVAGAKILTLMEKSQTEPFGGGRIAAATTLQQAFFSRQAGRKREVMLGVRPQLSHSMRLLRKELAANPPSPSEIRFMLQMEAYPWVLKHAIPTLGKSNITASIQQDMVLKSTDDLGRQSSNTPFQQAGTAYVYFSIGRSETQVADFLKPRQPDIISIRLQDFFHNGRLTTPLSHMILTAPQDNFAYGECYFLTFQGHSIEIAYQSDQDEKKACKTIRVTRPNGEIRERVLSRMDEVVEGGAILQWLAMNLLVMLRMMSPECQSQCQEDETSLNEFIDLVCQVKNYEVLIPRKLLLTDPRIQFSYYHEYGTSLDEKRSKIKEVFSQGYEPLRLLFTDKAIEPNFLITENETLLQYLLLNASFSFSDGQLSDQQRMNLAKILIDRGAELRGPGIPSILATLVAGQKFQLVSGILKLINYDLKNDIEMIVTILRLGNEVIFDEFEALGMRYHEVSLAGILEIIETSYSDPEEEGAALIERLQRADYPFGRYAKTERLVLNDRLDQIRCLGYNRLVAALERVGVRFAQTEINDRVCYCYIQHPRLGVIGVKYVDHGVLKHPVLPLLDFGAGITQDILRESLFAMIGYRMQSFTWELRRLSDGTHLCQVSLSDPEPNCFATDRTTSVRFFSAEEIGTLDEVILGIQSTDAYRDAVVNGDVVRVSELIPHRLWDISGYTLFCALEKNSVDLAMVKLILASGIYDINFPVKTGSEDRELPLNLAIYKKDLPLIGLLLEHGASLDVSDKAGKTPIMTAVMVNSIPILTYLLQCGANLAAKDGQSLLAFACLAQCSDEVFSWLLERTDNLNNTFQRYSPLLAVIMRQDSGRAEALVKRGADLNAINFMTNQPILKDLSRLRPDLVENAKVGDSLPLTHQLGVKGLLVLQGHGDDYNLNLALKSAYGLIDLDEAKDSALVQLLTQLRQDARIPESVDLCCCLFGKEAVVSCVGMDRPTLALNLDYLSIWGNQTAYSALVFAVRFQYELILTGKMKPMLSIPQIEYSSLECQVLKAFNIPYSDVEKILQHQASYSRLYDKPYFAWPGHVPPNYENRMKLLLYGVQSANVLVDTGTIMDRELSPAVEEAHKRVHSAVEEEKRCLGDFTLDDCSRVIDALNDALIIPNELCPTLSLKEWVFLEAVLARMSETEWIDSLLRLLVDKKSYLFGSVYSQVSQISEKLDWGYIKDYYDLQDRLKVAEGDSFEWESWADQVQELHQKLRVLLMGATMEMLYRQVPDSRLERRLFTPGSILVERTATKEFSLLSLPAPMRSCAAAFKERKIVNALFLMGFFDELMLANMDEGVLELLHDPEASSQPLAFFRRKLHLHVPVFDALLIQLWKEALQGLQLARLTQKMGTADTDLIALNEEYNRCNFYFPVLDDQAVQVAFKRMLTEAKEDPAMEVEIKNMLLSPDCFIYSHHANKDLLKAAMVEEIFREFPAWRFEDKLQILVNSHCCRRNAADLHLIAMIHPEWKELAWTDLIAVYRRAIYRCKRHTDWLWMDLDKLITRYFLAICPPYHIFQEEIVDIVLMLVKMDMTGCSELLLCPNPHDERYPPVSRCNLPVAKMVPLSRILSRYATLPEETYLLEFNQLLLERIEKIEDETQKIASIVKFIFISEAPYSYRITDELALTRAKEMLKRVLIERMAHKDDGGYLFRQNFLYYTHNMIRSYSDQDAREIIDGLSVALETQFELSQEINRVLNPPQSETGQRKLLQTLLGLDRLLVSIFGDDRYCLIEYLSSPGTKADRDKLFAIVDRVYEKRLKIYDGRGSYDKNQVKLHLMALYDSFWNCTLPQRAVMVDNLIIPSRSEIDPNLKARAYQRGFEFLCSKLFEGQAASPDDALIRSLLTSFLETALPEDKQLFLAAMFIAVKETPGRKHSVGDMLVGFLENMGPAGVKLGQAAHSHPNTRADLKQSLAKLKSRANPPSREDVWSWIKERLPPEQFSRITHLGEMLGSASVHVVMACAMAGYGDVVLSLTRPNAKEDSLKAYAHFERMIRHCQHPDFNNSLRSTMLLMIEEARKMVLDEIDDHLGVKQLQAAEKLYLKKAVPVPFGSQTITVMFHPCALVESGIGYRFLERGYGQTFSSLRADASISRDLIKAIAIAKLKVEMTHILTNRFDSDRHEEQELIHIRGDQINVYLFDFGELGLERLSQHETDSIATLLRQLPEALMKGKEPAQYLSEVIENCQKQGQPYRHFVRMQKAFLALSAYIEVVGLHGLREIFKSILFDINAKYRNALCYGYGWSLVQQGSAWFFQQAKTAVTLITGPTKSGPD